VLVIGYGSTLHSDDGVGPRIAEAVADWHASHITAVACTQLTPELAEPIAGSDEVIFVDAALKPIKPHNPRRSFGIVRLRPAQNAYELGQHFGDPRTLLALSQHLYGAHPRAWLVTVPGTNFGLGVALSPRTQRGMGEVLEYLQSLSDRASVLACEGTHRQPGP
jgi:hydrogenase maturation protease